jgi:hypothetical protein
VGLLSAVQLAHFSHLPEFAQGWPEFAKNLLPQVLKDDRSVEVH